jgi:Fe-S-cluster containining protein
MGWTRRRRAVADQQVRACTQCGKCCEIYGAGLTATADEVAWWETFRPHIARYVADGVLWVDPDSQQRLTRCPWLAEDISSGTFGCSIYFDRPEDCRHYPVTVSEMARDGCEMLELRDLQHPQKSQQALDELMSDSRPPLA